MLKQPPGEPLSVVGAGRYHDDFVREDGEWRFEERVSLFDLSGDVGGFLRAAPGRQPRWRCAARPRTSCRRCPRRRTRRTRSRR